MSDPRTKHFLSLPPDIFYHSIASMSDDDLINTYIQGVYKQGRAQAMKELLNRNSPTALRYLYKTLLGLIMNADLDNELYKSILTEKRINALLQDSSKQVEHPLRILLFIYREHISSKKSAVTTAIIKRPILSDDDQHLLVTMLNFLALSTEDKANFLKNVKEMLSDFSSPLRNWSTKLLIEHLHLSKAKILEVNHTFFSDLIDAILKAIEVKSEYSQEIVPRIVVLRQLMPLATPAEKSKIDALMLVLWKDIVAIVKSNNYKRVLHSDVHAPWIRTFIYELFMFEFANLPEAVAEQMLIDLSHENLRFFDFGRLKPPETDAIIKSLNSKQAYLSFKLMLQRDGVKNKLVKGLVALLARLESPELEQALDDFNLTDRKLFSLQLTIDMYTAVARKIDKSKLLALYRSLFSRAVNNKNVASPSLTDMMNLSQTDSWVDLSKFLAVIWEKMDKADKKTIIADLAQAAETLDAKRWLENVGHVIDGLIEILKHETDNEVRNAMQTNVVRIIAARLEPAFDFIETTSESWIYFRVLECLDFADMLDDVNKFKDCLLANNKNINYGRFVKIFSALLAKANTGNISDLVATILPLSTNPRPDIQSMAIDVLAKIVRAYPSQFADLWPVIDKLANETEKPFSRANIVNLIKCASLNMPTQLTEMVLATLHAMLVNGIDRENKVANYLHDIALAINNLLPKLSHSSMVTLTYIDNLINQYINNHLYPLVYPLIQHRLALFGAEGANAIFDKLFKSALSDEGKQRISLFYRLQHYWNEKFEDASIQQNIRKLTLANLAAAKTHTNEHNKSYLRGIVLWFLTQPSTTDDEASALTKVFPLSEYDNVYQRLFTEHAALRNRM